MGKVVWEEVVWDGMEQEEVSGWVWKEVGA